MKVMARFLAGFGLLLILTACGTQRVIIVATDTPAPSRTPLPAPTAAPTQPAPMASPIVPTATTVATPTAAPALSTPTPPAMEQAGSGLTCPAGYPIKGNSNSNIYHVPGQRFYDATNARRCFPTEQDALNAGFRKSQV